MKVQIKLEYRDKVYLSDIEEKNDTHTRFIENDVKEVMKDNMNFYVMKIGNKNTFFPEKVLKKSIITIIYNPE